MVHVEVPLARYSVDPWDPVLDRRQFIDIVVSDLSAFDVQADVFAKHKHDLFVEVKCAGHSTRPFHGNSVRTIRNGVSSDLARLKRNLDLGRCRLAAMLLIDDESHLERLKASLAWDPQIRPLLASPTQLKRRELAREQGITLPLSCPACGSPRVAPIVIGHASPELQDAADRSELILRGRGTVGEGLGSEYDCLDRDSAELHLSRSHGGGISDDLPWKPVIHGPLVPLQSDTCGDSDAPAR